MVRSVAPAVIPDPASVHIMWPPPPRLLVPSSNTITTIAPLARKAGKCEASHLSPVLTAHECMSWHRMGNSEMAGEQCPGRGERLVDVRSVRAADDLAVAVVPGEDQDHRRGRAGVKTASTRGPLGFGEYD